MTSLLLFLSLLAADPGEVRVRLVADELPSPTGAFRYAYNGVNPGPTIRAKVGDLLIVELENQLASATTIHWHGVHVPWAMDGITWMQQPIEPGRSFTYRFRLEHAGTFWYHPHLDTDGQVDGGLYGALIVEDPSEPRADQDLVWIFDSAGEYREHSGAHGHARIRGEHWLINGTHEPALRVRGGTVIRARLINASNSAYLLLRGSKLRVIAGDQGLLAAPLEPLELLLAPGDRAELEILPALYDLVFEAMPYTLNGGHTLGEHAHLLRLSIEQPRAAAAGLRWSLSGAKPSSGDPGHADIVYVFTGSDRGEVGMINGERFPNVTVEEVALGSAPVLEIRNSSPSEHPFHIHGVRFEVLSVNGVAPLWRTIEDTYNLRIRDRVRVRLFADNPGDWMMHCHILPHAEHGMMTVLRIR